MNVFFLFSFFVFFNAQINTFADDCMRCSRIAGEGAEFASKVFFREKSEVQLDFLEKIKCKSDEGQNLRDKTQEIQSYCSCLNNNFFCLKPEENKFENVTQRYNEEQRKDFTRFLSSMRKKFFYYNKAYVNQSDVNKSSFPKSCSVFSIDKKINSFSFKKKDGSLQECKVKKKSILSDSFKEINKKTENEKKILDATLNELLLSLCDKEDTSCQDLDREVAKATKSNNEDIQMLIERLGESDITDEKSKASDKKEMTAERILERNLRFLSKHTSESEDGLFDAFNKLSLESLSRKMLEESFLKDIEKVCDNFLSEAGKICEKDKIPYKVFNIPGLKGDKKESIGKILLCADQLATNLRESNNYLLKYLGINHEDLKQFMGDSWRSEYGLVDDNGNAITYSGRIQVDQKENPESVYSGESLKRGMISKVSGLARAAVMAAGGSSEATSGVTEYEGSEKERSLPSGGGINPKSSSSSDSDIFAVPPSVGVTVDPLTGNGNVPAKPSGEAESFSQGKETAAGYDPKAAKSGSSSSDSEAPFRHSSTANGNDDALDALRKKIEELTQNLTQEMKKMLPAAEIAAMREELKDLKEELKR
jgi:hypothetical protein